MSLEREGKRQRKKEREMLMNPRRNPEHLIALIDLLPLF